MSKPSFVYSSRIAPDCKTPYGRLVYGLKSDLKFFGADGLMESGNIFLISSNVASGYNFSIASTTPKAVLFMCLPYTSITPFFNSFFSVGDNLAKISMVKVYKKTNERFLPRLQNSDC